MAQRDRNGPVFLELARLCALVILDLVRPSKPENRLPRRWSRPRWVRRMT
jgi:hypothetical protein